MGTERLARWALAVATVKKAASDRSDALVGRNLAREMSRDEHEPSMVKTGLID
jgi:hypothetical protein